MVLSTERKIALELRYDVWGLEEVRKELQRPDRDQFVDPDVTAFTRAWVEAKDASAGRKEYYSMFLKIVSLVLLGLAVAVVLEF